MDASAHEEANFCSTELDQSSRYSHSAEFFAEVERSRQANSDAKRVSKETAMEAVRRCEKVVMKMRSSSVNDPTSNDALAPFEYQELLLGAKLGNGEFSDVYEIKSFSPSTKEGYRGKQVKAREFLTLHAKREKSNDARYAIKHLRPELHGRKTRFVMAAGDLAIETTMLASMEHPHIIKLRGMASGGTAGYANGLNTGYFLILDRLCDTLGQRMRKWGRKKFRYEQSKVKHLLDRKGKKNKKFFGDRLHIAFDIAGALEHLHSKRIIYRDLKPDNLGFDIRGDIKLFDFGLAKEVPIDSDSYNETYMMSGAGTLRYTAPEVALCQPYNLKADVYSFSMLLWQILELKVPFAGYSPIMYMDGVVNEGERPTLNEAWSEHLQNMLSQGWSPDLKERPQMRSFYNLLRRELATYRGGDNRGLDHFKRRSTHVLNVASSDAFEVGD